MSPLISTHSYEIAENYFWSGLLLIDFIACSSLVGKVLEVTANAQGENAQGVQTMVKMLKLPRIARLSHIAPVFERMSYGGITSQLCRLVLTVVILMNWFACILNMVIDADSSSSWKYRWHEERTSAGADPALEWYINLLYSSLMMVLADNMEPTTMAEVSSLFFHSGFVVHKFDKC